RALYNDAANTALQAARLDPSLEDRAERIAGTARYLHADQLVDAAMTHLDRQEVEPARAAFSQVIEKYADTPARVKAEVLLGTLERAALEIKARELEKRARQAEAEADATERARRKPADDWLA